MSTGDHETLSGSPVAPQSRSLRSALVADLVHMVDRTGKSPGRWAAEVVVRTVVVPRVRAVVMLRLSQAAARRSSLLALAIQGRALRASGAEISPHAEIGPGLCLMHSSGIVIGQDVRIGRGARIYQGVTLGDGSQPGQPTIGDDVTIGAGAVVLGGVTVGDRVIVGAGAVVTKDVPSDSIATGAPATHRPRRPGMDPRLDELAQGALAG